MVRNDNVFIHIIYLDTVTILNMVNDNVSGKASSDGIIRKSLFQITFNCADIQAAAVIEAGAEAEYQQFIVPDIIRISGIIQRSIAGIIIFFLFSRSSFTRAHSSGVCGTGIGIHHGVR